MDFYIILFIVIHFCIFCIHIKHNYKIRNIWNLKTLWYFSQCNQFTYKLMHTYSDRDSASLIPSSKSSSQSVLSINSRTSAGLIFWKVCFSFNVFYRDIHLDVVYITSMCSYVLFSPLGLFVTCLKSLLIWKLSH